MHLNFTKSYIENNTWDVLKKEPNLCNINDITQPIGQEHYMFLASLGIQLKNKTIVELGTHKGVSAYVLSYGNRHHNSQNRIVTYDISKFDMPFIDLYNIEYKLSNLFDKDIREKNRNLLLNSDVIFIDIDPHEGILEYEMYKWLKDNNYKGIIIYDDIKLNRGHMGSQAESSMIEFWMKIPESEKIDLTNVGHWSGTGLVCFNLSDHIIVTN